jgi:hypothetical protein
LPSKFWIFFMILFSSRSPNEHVFFHKRGHVFVVFFFWNQLYDFIHSF